MNQSAPSPLIVVVGPTGSGKTALSLHLADLLDGEIVGCDSLQVYRYFNIGTAKPSPEERCGAVHHLVDVLDPTECFTAGDYARCAREANVDITSRGRVPIVVGGTGFYLSALLDGLFEGPPRDETLRARLLQRENRRPGSLHRLLGRFDPATAARVHLRDVNKTVRALEISLLARRPASQMFAQGRQGLSGYRIAKVGLNPPRDQLYARLNRRASEMFENGLVEEVRTILGLGYSPDCKPFESLGYRQALLLIEGQLSREEAIALTQRDTRRYAKRQLTWFRRDKEINWFEGFGEEHPIQVAIDSFLDGFTKVISP